MKALPLWQPYASLIAYGAKRVETRDFPPRRLGLVAGQRIVIHACKTPRDLRMLDLDWFVDHVPFGFPPADQLPLGALVAVCTLDRAAEITEQSAADLFERNPQEHAFGNYARARWAWVLRDIERFAEPIPFTGSQGTFEVDDELISTAGLCRSQAPASPHPPSPSFPVSSQPAPATLESPA